MHRAAASAATRLRRAPHVLSATTTATTPGGAAPAHALRQPRHRVHTTAVAASPPAGNTIMAAAAAAATAATAAATTSSGAGSSGLTSFGVRGAEVTYPSGDPSFAVLQAFPSAFTAEEADPFLMCDDFGPALSTGKITEPDRFPLGWHPHRGQDVLTYLTRGVGRHGDSMGNREEFESPSMQWICAGSGIEHAEGGGTPAGEWMQGFQIWINVPAERKMDPPKYGTNPASQIPVLPLGAAGTGSNEGGDGGAGSLGFARLLAGSSGGRVGPFKTIADVQMLDFTLLPTTADEPVLHTLPAGLDNVLVYVYEGDAVVGGEVVRAKSVVRFEPDSSSGAGAAPAVLSLQVAPGVQAVTEDRGFGTGHGAKMLLFAGKKLKQPIAWHGPFVMNTQDEIRQAIREYRGGTFLKSRFPGDYKVKAEIDRVNKARAAAAPAAAPAADASRADDGTGDAAAAARDVDAATTQCAPDAP